MKIITPGELAENHADELTPRVIALAVLVRSCCPNNFSDGFFEQYLGQHWYHVSNFFRLFPLPFREICLTLHPVT